MGVKNAMPVDRVVFEFYVKTLKRLTPEEFQDLLAFLTRQARALPPAKATQAVQ